MATNEANRLFLETSEQVLHDMWEAHPNFASWLGLHQYDGRLPDVSRPTLARRARHIERSIDALERIDVPALSRQSYFDYQLMLSALRRELYDLTEVKTHEYNPLRMLWAIDFGNYIHREYAPLEQRAEALTRALRGVPSYLESVKENLRRRLSKPILEFAIESYEGIAGFYDKDLTEAMQPLTSADLKRQFQEARDAASRAVRSFVEYLKSLTPQATTRFSIGSEHFIGLLKRGELVNMPLERLLEVGEADLKRNLARLRDVAAQIEPSSPPGKVMQRVAKDHPRPETLLSETGAMLEELRQYVISQNIATVPSEVRCATRETPSFMRWAFAAMDLPGALETKAAEAFYYVTPPEDDWTDEQKEQWLTSFNYATLKIVSIHEAYPGHYVHHLHTMRVPSRISRIFSSYAFSEGWAHYTEEMMLEAGYGYGDGRLALGQLAEALLRDCRYICAIRMHTQGMTLDEATEFFIKNAYMEELPARKEATRGSFDPMYLNYTLGKLMIKKLREDYRRVQGRAYSLKQFHDTLLSFGAPPLPLAREMMLREPGGDIV